MKKKRIVKAESNSHLAHEVRHSEAQKAVIIVSVTILILLLLISLLFYAAPKATVKGMAGDAGDLCPAEVDDCADPNCFSKPECKGESCAEGKIVTWSYQLPTELNKKDSNEAPLFVGCCPNNQCYHLFEGVGRCASAGPYTDGLCASDQIFYECTDVDLNQEKEHYSCKIRENNYYWDLLPYILNKSNFYEVDIKKNGPLVRIIES